MMTQQTAGHLLIGTLHVAQIPAEAVLIQLLMGMDIPEAAGVRARS